MLRFFAFLLLLAALAAGAWFWEQWNFQAPGPSPTYKVVMVAPGDHLGTVAKHLVKDGVVANSDLFRIGVQIRGLQGQIKAGEYGFPAQASMADVADILISGKSILHKLTAAEGLTSKMIYDIVQSDPVLVGDVGEVPDEGTLLPETYLFTRGTTRAEMLARMKRAQDKVLAQLWHAHEEGLPLKTKSDAIVLASIIEKETALPEERRRVAAVFANRLKLGMKLQSDPTIIYDVTRGYPLGRGIRQSELDRASPHNTYVIAGLPPTPICNPGRESIAAALNPANTDALYFVADGRGGHVFSTSIVEQNANVWEWRKIEKSRKRLLPVSSIRR